ncbi:MAG: Rieske 2Fe-2S domain-containing protein [Alphaproteobacteria bacterium]|nr:Rieske 2Fe-2S domain-containing protein [Alphaproteobacteria bacterium]
MPLRPLCRRDDIADPGARGFVFGEGLAREDVFLVRRGGLVRGYRNACPHQGAPLETFPDQFLTADGATIICSLHGARFRVEDGACIAGPCLGKSLVPILLIEMEGVFHWEVRDV